MIDLICNLKSEVELIKKIDLEKTINRKIGDISSISYDSDSDTTYLLSDSDPSYYIRINDQLLKSVNSSSLISQKIKFKNYKNSFNIYNDAESFYLDNQNLFVISGISNYPNKTVLLKYDYLRKELEDFIEIDLPNEKFYSISSFQNDNLILLNKSKFNKDKKDFIFTKYRIYSKNLKFLNSGFIRSQGVIQDFQKIKNMDVFLSLIDFGNKKKIGVFKLDDFLNKKNEFVENKYNINLPKYISKFKNIQGISLGPISENNKTTILLVNDNNKKRFSKNSKFFKNFRFAKYQILRILGKVRKSQIFVLQFKGTNC